MDPKRMIGMFIAVVLTLLVDSGSNAQSNEKSAERDQILLALGAEKDGIQPDGSFVYCSADTGGWDEFQDTATWAFGTTLCATKVKVSWSGSNAVPATFTQFIGNIEISGKYSLTSTEGCVRVRARGVPVCRM